MGPLSARHFSNYPPIHQLPFVITALISSTSILGSVVGLRMIIILADIGVFIFGVKLLKTLKLPTKNIAYYFLNPLVIIELTGNLHFEGLMLFFLVAAVYFLQQNKILRSGIFMSFSILTKLIPVLFLPLLIQRLGRKNSLRYFGVILLCSLLFTLPFFEVEFLKNGIRPTVADRRPLVGQHETHKNLYVMNGLGSRGVLIAPSIAKDLIAHIEDDITLPKEIDINRFKS